jgi:hypothetical protein
MSAAARSGARPPQYHQTLSRLGIDGLDPDLVSHFMHERNPPNMQKLARANSVAMLRCADM